MFTGLIQEMGQLKSIRRASNSMQIEIGASTVLKEAELGASIAVNGVCLTAIQIHENSFVADVMPETWHRTRLKDLEVGDWVNLEKSVTPNTFLGGHLVYGDVDSVGTIVSVRHEGIALLYEIELEPDFMKYVAFKGRVAIDGASLTVMKRSTTTFTVSLIPHSAKNLVLGRQQVGDKVNIETDIVAKYCENLVSGQNEDPLNEGSSTKAIKSTLTLEKLAENGFI